MTQAKAATVATDLILAGYNATTSVAADGTTWLVYASSRDSTPVAVGTIQTFATNHGVTADATAARFV